MLNKFKNQILLGPYKSYSISLQNHNNYYFFNVLFFLSLQNIESKLQISCTQFSITSCPLSLETTQ